MAGDIEQKPAGIPVLLRQYLRLVGKLLGFNLDPKFANALGGLILVDPTKTEPKLLDRYLGPARRPHFSVHWDGNLALHLSDPNNNPGADPDVPWKPIAVTGLTASTDSTVSQINGRQDTWAMYFDDVVVDASGTPEPATFALVGIGLVAAATARRRKRG